eukprot:CAMPEP_0197178514 /NCGR_PEP_ID=MMETSP1423-20130617/3772_1 /TAXON_ID=476441 /ORGANISM="Pseudo-nitzschia heimii, Strain UNC1101" /LENGTH=394 /DNA_ID=CAMNT_0042628273 /DNA_START=121 /DNA_END=1305 /DNA_ORIENTATION=-
MIKRSTVAKWLLLKTAIATGTAATNPTPPLAAFVASRTVSSVVGHPSPLPSQRRRRNPVEERRGNSITSDGVYRGKSSLFESMRTGYYRKTNSDEISMDKLLEKAASVRSRNPSESVESLASDSGRLFFPSSYDASRDEERTMTTRGFSNWIVPGTIMVGQYPGRVPETGTPTEDEVEAHLRRVLFGAAAPTADAAATTRSAAREVCFVSLQSELPPQDDHESWNKRGGEIHLSDPASRRQWPNPFSHYAPTVDAVLRAAPDDGPGVSVRYLHHPIQDLSVPSNSKNLRLLLWKILDFLDSGDTETLVYIHCWGGRGRAGLTASCLLTLLEFASRPTATSCAAILEVVQTGYASRDGSEDMPPELSRSPQTDSQRAFVKTFYEEVRAGAANAAA